MFIKVVSAPLNDLYCNWQ